MINILKLRKMEKEKSEGKKQNVKPEDELVSLDEGKIVEEPVKEKKADSSKKEKKKITDRDKKTGSKKKKAAEKQKKEEKKKAPPKKNNKGSEKPEIKKTIPEIEEIPVEDVPVIKDEPVEETVKTSKTQEQTSNIDAEEAFRQKLMEELLAEDFSVEPGIEDWPSDIFGNGSTRQDSDGDTKEKTAEPKETASVPQEKSKPATSGEDELPELTPEEQAEVDRKKTETLQKFLAKTSPDKQEETEPKAAEEIKTVSAKPENESAEEKKADTASAPSEKDKSSENEKNKKIEDTVQLIGFKLEEELYGVDINCIREINRITSITLVPNVPEYVEGVINLRGNVIPIINLRVKTQMPRKDFDNETRIIIIENESIVVGLIVDEVKEVLRIPESIITPPPAIAVSETAEYIKAVARTENGLIVLLDTDKLLDRVDFT